MQQLPAPIRPVPINATHRIQSITPMPQVQRSNVVRPVSRSPTPYQSQTKMQQLEMIFQGDNKPQPAPTNISLLARGISLLSITQLRELLREYSLPTGGNKHILVNRLVIFLETFGQNQQSILAPFSTKLKHLLSTEPGSDHGSPQSSPVETIHNPVSNEVADRIFQGSPTCLFDANHFYEPAFGPIMTPYQPNTQPYKFMLTPPNQDVTAVLQLSGLTEYVIQKAVLQLNGQYYTLTTDMLWIDLSDFHQRPTTLQFVTIEPPMSIGIVVRWLKKVPLSELTVRISQKESPYPSPLSGAPPNGVCPLTRKLICKPARGMKCAHGECFDLTGFLCYAIKNKTWQCPICHKSLQPEELRIDPGYFQICQCSF